MSQNQIAGVNGDTAGLDVTHRDLEMFQAIGVSPHLLRVARVRRVTHAEARELCGIRYKSDHLEGLAFPYLNPDDDQARTWRVRRDNPEVDTNGKPIAKYVSPPDRKCLYFVPSCYPQLADTSAPAIFVESEKAVLALVEAETRSKRGHGLLIATGGCWGWRGVVGKATSANGARVDQKGPLPDFDRVTWTGRDTVIVFDANVATNEKVQAARLALAAELAKRGANVQIAELPVENGMNGPDDYIGKYGAAAFWKLIDSAKPTKRSQDKSIANLVSELELTAEAVRDITPDLLSERLRALAVALTGADGLRRALVADVLKKISKVPAAIVTAALATRDDKPGNTIGGTITLTDDEPWPEPVSGAVLLDETATLIRRHLIMSRAQADAIAVWIASAYAIDALSLMSILLVTAPTWRSGKTTLLTLLGAIVPRALAVSNLTGAVLARANRGLSPYAARRRSRYVAH